MVDLANLEILITVARAGSLTAAGQHLGCSQSTVSRRIARLEAEYGTSLLERNGAQASLTPAGRAVVEAGTTMLEQQANLRRQLRLEESQLTGVIDIVASSAPAKILPRLIDGFAKRHPGVRFDVAIADSAQVRMAIAEQRADLGLSGTSEDDPRLQFVPFATDELVVVVPPRHRFASLRRVPFTELAGEKLISREPGSGTQRVFSDAYRRAGFDPDRLEVGMVVGSASAVVDSVRAGLGIGVVSESEVPWRASDLVGVRLTDAVTRALWLVLNAGRRPLPQREAFVEHVTAARLVTWPSAHQDP